MERNGTSGLLGSWLCWLAERFGAQLDKDWSKDSLSTWSPWKQFDRTWHGVRGRWCGKTSTLGG
eukprot:4849602-Amphidinium_carterae.1